MRVQPIKNHEVNTWILNKHYAKRMPPITYAFGAYKENILIGVITYGIPVSSALRTGIAGDENSRYVLELNRLVCSHEKNTASQLISKSLKLLPSPSIIVSYADTGQGHVGYVYQATNFIYTGLSEKRTDWKVKGLEHLHGATIADQSRGQENRVEWMREKYGDDFYLKDRPRKHRYIFIKGTRKQKKKITKEINYKTMEYPKGDSIKYNDEGYTETQLTMCI